MTTIIILAIYLIGCVYTYGRFRAVLSDTDMRGLRYVWLLCIFPLFGGFIIGLSISADVLDGVNTPKGHLLQFRSDASIERRRQAKLLKSQEVTASYDFENMPYEAERWK